jgi:hypothetical protein
MISLGQLMPLAKLGFVRIAACFFQHPRVQVGDPCGMFRPPGDILNSFGSVERSYNSRTAG